MDAVLLGDGPVAAYFLQHLPVLTASKALLLQLRIPGRPAALGPEFIEVRLDSFPTLTNLIVSNKINSIFLVTTPEKISLDNLAPDNETLRYLDSVPGETGMKKTMQAALNLLKKHEVRLAHPGEIFPELRFGPSELEPPNASVEFARLWSCAAVELDEQPPLYVKHACVASEHGTVDAEEISGTDAMLRQIGDQSAQCADRYLFKMPIHPFAMIAQPTIGLETIKLCAEKLIKGIVIDPKYTLVFDKAQCLAHCKAHSLRLIDGSTLIYAKKPQP